jgi:AcrR family transcriptional regulator
VVIRSQRTRILRAMAETLAERGYAATTVSQVVARAGVSSATFYELFHDKEDCLLAAAREIIAQVTTVVTEAYGRGDGDRDALGDAIASLLALLAEQPAYAHLLLIECRGTTPRALDLYLSGARALLSMLGRGWANTTSGVSPELAARAVLGAAEALIRSEIAHGRAERLPELLPRLMYCALVPFRGIDEALARSRAAGETAEVGG